MNPPLGAHNPRVRELRALLRDRRARDDAGVFVVDGPRVLAVALDRRVSIDAVYVGVDAPEHAQSLAARAERDGIRVERLARGLAARVGETITPQGVFGVVRRDPRAGRDAFARTDFAVVVAQTGDPGNAGTLWRSAAASGAGAYLLGRGSVDAYNPKLVRATAGACFSVPVVDDVDVVGALDACGARGLLRVGAVVDGGAPLDAVGFTQPCAVVLGHEARGLPADLPLDTTVTIPMAVGTESLNLAMAGTVLCFEVARQRRARAAGERA